MGGVYIDIWLNIGLSIGNCLNKNESTKYYIYHIIKIYSNTPEMAGWLVLEFEYKSHHLCTEIGIDFCTMLSTTKA